jgi:hypothetical protein
VTKAVVNDYFGREIPGHERLGLDRDRVYQLLRDPDELRSSVSRWNGLPVLRDHQPLSVAAFDSSLVVGSSGNDATFSEPYLLVSLSLWSGDVIEQVRDGQKRALSAGYSYVPDLSKRGTFAGRRYDAVMRSIRPNHIAVVDVGRAGRDVAA